MTPLFNKAETASKSARRLLADQDYDGACDRAYYAMFNAVRALLEAESQLESTGAKTHRSTIRLFSETFVLSGRADRELGRGLNFVQSLRFEADYKPSVVTAEEAEKAITIMERMLDFARHQLSDIEEKEP